ncbi:XkdX family protein [Staphylococcus warneri]|uniref:XkdX family protein n=1 Tax=Staphylococcus TaxID=1279 RepID=UPI000990EDC1|nr:MULTISPECIES: XkdX family protein [Staphylococcus]MCG7307102.1 XkdX family protein [Staphylococcus warneri]MCM3482239.1 XkdX family protein [Staphylococcus warneri]MCT1632249.1 XkdX family protein [Staphylococcus warneri]MCT2348274.1 XkdX family protein [Staphylococcus warneri]MCV7476652.1 XkdX family protein [Staphylococcus warneri]
MSKNNGFISPTFNEIKQMYLWDCLTNDDIHWYVEMEVLDTVDYALITGEKYIDKPQA